jgi:hypothetical protein
MLYPSWRHFADGFGHLPGVLAPNIFEQPAKVAVRSFSDLGPQEAVGDTRMQLFKMHRPPLDGLGVRSFVAHLLRDNLPPLALMVRGYREI